MRLAIGSHAWFLVGFFPSFGVSIAMVFELVEVVVDFRQTAGF